jgi:hypothetical protein
MHLPATTAVMRSKRLATKPTSHLTAPQGSWLGACVVALLVCTLPSARAAEPTQLRWQVEGAKPYYAIITSESTSVITFSNRSTSKLREKDVGYFAVSPTRLANGDWALRYRLEAVKGDVDIGGKIVSFDSTKQKQPISEEEALCMGLVGAEFVVDVKHGYDTKLERWDDVMKKMVREKKLGDILEPMPARWYARTASPITVIIPTAPVRVGDTWEGETQWDTGFAGNVPVIHRYKFEGFDDRSKTLARIRLDEFVRHDLIPRKANRAMVAAAHLELRIASGSIGFDNARGRIKKAERKSDFNLWVQIQTADSTEALAAFDQTNTVTSTDVNPLK